MSLIYNNDWQGGGRGRGVTFTQHYLSSWQLKKWTNPLITSRWPTNKSIDLQLYWIIGALLSIKTVSHSFLYCRTLVRRISRDREKVSLIEFCGDSTEVLNVTDYSTGIPASTAVDVVYTEDVVASAQKTANSGGGAQTRRETQPVFSVIQCS